MDGTVQIEWRDGSGQKLTARGDARGVAFSSEPCEGLDRELTVRLSGGGAALDVPVKQTGRREEFFTAGDGPYDVYDGAFITIKREYL